MSNDPGVKPKSDILCAKSWKSHILMAQLPKSKKGPFKKKTHKILDTLGIQSPSENGNGT